MGSGAIGIQTDGLALFNLMMDHKMYCAGYTKFNNSVIPIV